AAPTPERRGLEARATKRRGVAIRAQGVTTVDIVDITTTSGDACERAAHSCGATCEVARTHVGRTHEHDMRADLCRQRDDDARVALVEASQRVPGQCTRAVRGV